MQWLLTCTLLLYLLAVRSLIHAQTTVFKVSAATSESSTWPVTEATSVLVSTATPWPCVPTVTPGPEDTCTPIAAVHTVVRLEVTPFVVSIVILALLLIGLSIKLAMRIRTRHKLHKVAAEDPEQAASIIGEDAYGGPGTEGTTVDTYFESVYPVSEGDEVDESPAYQLMDTTKGGDAITGHTTTADTATGDTATWDTATGDTATWDTATGDSATGDTATGDTACHKGHCHRGHCHRGHCMPQGTLPQGTLPQGTLSQWLEVK